MSRRACLALALGVALTFGPGAHAAEPPSALPPAPPAPPAQEVVEKADTFDAPLPPPMQIVPEIVDAPKPPPGLLRGPLGLCKIDPCVSPFWRDTDVRLHFRSFFFDRHNPDLSRNKAWAAGGWLSYKSGWWRDILQVGATGFTSQPLDAPEAFDGTSLLAPGQEGITVLGEAFVRLRYKEAAILTAYRQSLNTGYVGPQDNRMIPNTFEGLTLRGTLDEVKYDVGYVWEMKPRNLDEFIPMGEQAGVLGSDTGLWYGSVHWEPNDCWELYAGDFYTEDIHNTLFLQAKHFRDLGRCAELQMGAQLTDQRSIGDEELGSFETWNVGLGARVIWDWGLTVGTAFHATGEDANIRSPYGTWPGYLSLIETDFDRANEKALGIGVKYDFGKSRTFCAPGLLVVLAYAHGWDRVTPGTGTPLPDTDELDFDVTWDVPRVKGLQLRFRNAYVDTDGAQTGYQFRVILNWDIDLF
jgi:hypothetical protein